MRYRYRWYRCRNRTGSVYTTLPSVTAYAFGLAILARAHGPLDGRSMYCATMAMQGKHTRTCVMSKYVETVPTPCEK